jgi:hypothetical protein
MPYDGAGEIEVETTPPQAKPVTPVTSEPRSMMSDPAA